MGKDSLLGTVVTEQGVRILKECRFRSDIWKKFLILRVVRYWTRLPREVVVDSSSLEVFMARLNETLSNVVWWEMCMPMARELELDDL